MTVADDLITGLAATGLSLRGDQGAKGDRGDQGPKGDKGDTGPKGDKGAKGEDGKDGVGPDEKVRLNASDPKAGFLDDKLEAGRGVYLIKKQGSNGDKLIIEVPTTRAVMGVGGGSSSSGGGSQTALTTPFTPAGTISATNVQAAIEEVAAEAGGGTLADTLTAGNDTGGTDIVHEATGTDDADQTINVTAEQGSANLAINVSVADDTESGEPSYNLVVTAPAGPNAVDAFIGTSALAVDGDADSENVATTTGSGSAIVHGIAKALGNDGSAEAVQEASIRGAVATGLARAQLRANEDFHNFEAVIEALANANGSAVLLRGVNAEPPDVLVATSGLAFWFDPTDGAASPMWKGKSADGTVVSGSLGGGSVTPATDPGDIADPTLSTAEDVAGKLNTLMANLRTAGMLA